MTTSFAQRLDSIARIRREIAQRYFLIGAGTATAVFFLVALWVRAGQPS